MVGICSSHGKLVGGSSASPSLVVDTFITHCAAMKEKDVRLLTGKKSWLMDMISKLQPFINCMVACGTVVLAWKPPMACIVIQWKPKTKSEA